MRKKGHVNAEKKIFFYRLQMNRKCKAVLFFFVASTGCMSYWLMDSGKAVSKVRRSLYLEDDMNSTNQNNYFDVEKAKNKVGNGEKKLF